MRRKNGKKSMTSVMLVLMLIALIQAGHEGFARIGGSVTETWLKPSGLFCKETNSAGASFLSYVEPPTIESNRTYGGPNDDYGNSVIQTVDGGYAIAGSTNSFGAGLSDFWLVKTDANGTMQWSRTYGGSSNDLASCVIQTVDGGYAIAGFTGSFGSGGDFWLVKTDGSGNIQWTQTYGGPEHDYARSIIQTADGGYAIVGTFSHNEDDKDFMLVKTDGNGSEIYSVHVGREGVDEAYSVVQSEDGGFLLVGYTMSFGVNGDFWLVKMNGTGYCEWYKSYGGAGLDAASSVVQSGDGGYAVAGCTTSFGAGGGDFWLVRTDANGNELWNTTYGGVHNDYANSLCQTGDGGYALLGYSDSFVTSNYDFWVVKIDAYGTETWNTTCGGPDIDVGNSVVQTADGDYALAGFTKSFGSGMSDSWLIRLHIRDSPPHPWIVEPSNSDLLSGDDTIVWGNSTDVRAVDMGEDEDISMASFWFSVDGSDWNIIGTDSNGTDGYGVEWNTTQLTEGYHIIKAVMEDAANQIGQNLKIVYYDPHPPVPRIIQPIYLQRIRGTVEFKVNTTGNAVASMMFNYYNGSSYWIDKQGFGDVTTGEVGAGGYCGPTSTADALVRLAEKDKELTKVPPKMEDEYEKIFREHHKAMGRDPDDFDLDDYMTGPKGNRQLTPLGLAVVLAKMMKMDPVTGTSTAQIEDQLKKYLNDRKLDKDYDIKTQDHPKDTDFIKEQLWTCESVIVHTVKLGPGPDGKLCTADDTEVPGTEHFMTVKDYWIIYGYGGMELPDSISFIDPSHWNPDWSEQGKCSPLERSCTVRKVSGKVGGVQTDFIKICGEVFVNGIPTPECRKIKWVCSISPNAARKQKLGIPNNWIFIGEDQNGADGWNFYCDTATIRDGIYVMRAEMVEANGNRGTDDIMIFIRNYPTDIDRNMKIDITDVAMTSAMFGAYPGHSRWNPFADVNPDGRIDIMDLAMVSAKFGRVY